MLIYIPILFLILGAISIFIIIRTNNRIGLTWIIAAGSSFAAWLVTILLRLYLPSTVSLIRWKPETLFRESPFLMIDYNSWPYAAILVTILVAFIFTDSARSKDKINPLNWTGSMAMTALGLMAVLAGNPLTMVLAWAIVDIVEFIYLLSVQADTSHNRRVVLIYAFRMLSLIMLVWAVMVGWSEIGPFDIESIPDKAGVYFLIAAGLRLGILPFNLMINEESDQFSPPVSVIRYVPIAASLSLITRMPPNFMVIRPNWMLAVQIIISASAVIGSILWVIKSSSPEGKPFWNIALTSLAILAAVNGQAAASRAWGIALLASGSLMTFFNPPIKRMRFLLFFGLIGILALPYTPAISGWQGLVGNGFSLWSLIGIITHTLLVIGFLNFIKSTEGSSVGLESWSKISYPIGLILIIQTQIGLGLVGWPDSFSSNYWWMSIISLSLIGLFFFFAWLLRKIRPNTSITTRLNANKKLEALNQRFVKLGSFDWAIKPLSIIYQSLGKLTSLLTSFLEGDAGIIWALVFLILLISFIRFGVTP